MMKATTGSTIAGSENQVQSLDVDSSTVKDKVVDSRKQRLTGSVHFGDVDFVDEETVEIEDATWGEVLQACCIHDPKEWALLLIRMIAACLFLYFFLASLDLLGTSAKILSGCTAGALFGDDQNPVAGLMIGIICTVLIQSSSTTTSVIVSLVGSDTVGVKSAIYMIMGANIGTSVTNTIVAMGQMADGDELERAFAGATVHDVFNFLSAAILFIIEIITHYLYYLSKVMLPSSVKKGTKWEGPIKKIVAPLVNQIIISNKNAIKHVADGGSCQEFYPTQCSDNNVTAESCTKVGLIKCNSKTNKCPIFFQQNATRKDDEVSGGVCFFLALVMLVICLVALVSILKRLLLGMSTRIIYKATNLNGYLTMLIGCGITILVQSSSITTSVLTPFVGMGVIHLEQMFPLTLGANIGTTVTALMASMVSAKIEALQIALCHLFFNLTGILIWYPIPFMRRIPLHIAKMLGKMTRIWRGFPLVYIIVVFFLIPLLLLGLSMLFEQGSKGYTALGCILVIIVATAILWAAYKWYNGGRHSFKNCLENRHRERQRILSLPNDIDELGREIELLKSFVGYYDDVELTDKNVGGDEETVPDAEGVDQTRGH